MIAEEIESLESKFQSHPEDVDQFKFDFYATKISSHDDFEYHVSGTDGKWTVSLRFDSGTLEPHILFLDLYSPSTDDHFIQHYYQPKVS